MEWLFVLFCFFTIGPLLPFVALIGTGLTTLFLQVLTAVVYESR